MAAISIGIGKMRAYASIGCSRCRWLGAANLIGILAAQYSGFRQHRASFAPWLRCALRDLHAGCSGALLLFWFVETLVLWRPSKDVHAMGFAAAYTAVLLATFGLCHYGFESGRMRLPDSHLPGIHEAWEVPLEWLLVAIHLGSVWRRSGSV